MPSVAESMCGAQGVCERELLPEGPHVWSTPNHQRFRLNRPRPLVFTSTHLVIYTVSPLHANFSQVSKTWICVHMSSHVSLRIWHTLSSTRILYKWLCFCVLHCIALYTVKMKVAQLCLTLCDTMDYTLHGILQARILEWVAFPFSRGSSQPRDRTQVSLIVGRFFTSWATREAQEYWSG